MEPSSFQQRIANTAVGFGTKPLRAVGLSGSTRAAREQILHRAYAIWEGKGRPDNSQLEDWLQAEAEVLEGRFTLHG